MDIFFGTDTLADRDTLRLFGRLATNLVFTAIVIRVVYYRIYRNREYVFTCYLFNIITFDLAKARSIDRKVSTPTGHPRSQVRTGRSSAPAARTQGGDEWR